MSAQKRKSFAQLARERLALPAEPEEELAEMKKRRAEGWLFLGQRSTGMIILPPVTPDE